MQNDQRSQPTGYVTAPGTEPAPGDADVVQAALRLHLQHFHTLEAAHAEAEEALAGAEPAPPSAAERAAAHHARREAFGQRRGFLEQLTGFPTSALNTLSAADMQSLRVPAGAGAAALRTHGAKASSAATQQPSHTDHVYPEDSPDYVEELDGGFLDDAAGLGQDPWGAVSSTESWELVPAGPRVEEPAEEPPERELPAGPPQEASGTEEQAEQAAVLPPDETAETSGRSYLPEERPDFRDLVRGRAEVSETSPKKQRRWKGLRRKDQPET